MWEIYKKEAEMHQNVTEKAVAEAQKGDADGVLVFVGYNILIVSPLGLTSFKDWSILRGRRCVHCRRLQEVIP